MNYLKKMNESKLKSFLSMYDLYASSMTIDDFLDLYLKIQTDINEAISELKEEYPDSDEDMMRNIFKKHYQSEIDYLKEELEKRRPKDKPIELL